jgi:hypothetical protein
MSINRCINCEAETQYKPKFACIETFEDCVEAASRRNHWYLTLNHSRPALHQTGEGHFSPMGGYFAKARQVYLMDVARYKYPSYWCDLDIAFESLLREDKDAGKTRGFSLIGRNLLHYSELCRTYDDYSLQEIVERELTIGALRCDGLYINKNR